MPMKSGDTFAIAKQRADLNAAGAEILRHNPKRPGDVLDLLAELWNLCERFNRDFALYVALCVNETDWFSHVWWERYRNPASIGVTGVAAQNAESPKFASGKQAAQFLFLLIEIKIQRAMPEKIADYAAINRAKATETLTYARDLTFPTVRKLSDLGLKFGPRDRECVWFCDPAGAAAVAEKGNAIFADLPNQEKESPSVVKLTPYPNIIDRPLPDKFGAGMSWLARWHEDTETIDGTFTHSMLGWLMSTDAYFRLPSVEAATDYGIGGAGDGANDGVIIRWINYHERRNTAGWASGWSAAPDYDGRGKEYVDRFGRSAINGTARSMELSGLATTPISAKQWTALIQLTAAIHHHEAKQSWDRFEWQMQHRDVAEKDCAFPRYYKYLDRFHELVVLVMRHYETGFAIPETATIAGLTIELPGGKGAGTVTPPPAKPIFVPFPEKTGRVFHTQAGAISRQWGERTAVVVKHYKEDVAVRIVGYVHGEAIDGDDHWFVIKSAGPSNNARIHASGLKEHYIDPGAAGHGGSN